MLVLNSRIERTSTLLILPTVRIVISDLGRMWSSHNTVATFYKSPQRSPIDFYHPPHNPALHIICTGLIPIPIPITSNPRPSWRSQNYSPPGLKSRVPGLLLQEPKSCCFPSYKLGNLESERRSRLSGSFLISSRSIGRTILRCPRQWT